MLLLLKCDVHFLNVKKLMLPARLELRALTSTTGAVLAWLTEAISGGETRLGRANAWPVGGQQVGGNTIPQPAHVLSLNEFFGLCQVWTTYRVFK